MYSSMLFVGLALFAGGVVSIPSAEASCLVVVAGSCGTGCSTAVGVGCGTNNCTVVVASDCLATGTCIVTTTDGFLSPNDCGGSCEVNVGWCDPAGETADCTINVGTCLGNGDCTVNVALLGDRCNGQCLINVGVCSVLGGHCEVNLGECYAFCSVNGLDPAYCDFGGDCTVNLGYCAGRCTVNLGDCFRDEFCTVKLSSGCLI
jgi:hypothetical protein